ncbi:hypothetical protein ABPG74_013760 [Tetrahymena malaccensis]
MNQSPVSYQSAFKTDLCGMSVKFSLFDPTRIAVSSSANFGIVGKGKQLVLNMLPNGQMNVLNSFELPDSVLDCCWTELNENLLITCCGNGMITLWDLQKNTVVKEVKGHIKEINSGECSYKQPHIFLSSGKEGRVKVWDLNVMKCLFELPAHIGQCYQATWHPVNDGIFATVGSDSTLKLWDLNTPNKSIAGLRAHDGEVLGCDFNKYQDIMATCSTDLSLRIWDLKNLKVPLNILGGHRYPIKRVKYSPFHQSILASCSYDMNVCVWDTSDPVQPLKFTHNKHTEFVMGLDFSIHNDRQLASTSWDGRVLVWDFDKPQPQIQ